MKNQEIWDLQTPWRHRASFMFNLLSNLFCSFFLLLKVEVQKKEQNKFDNKLNIKDAQWRHHGEIASEKSAGTIRFFTEYNEITKLTHLYN